MDGIINVYKEKGFTSHDVVAKLRGILRQKKIGHTGTLDPDAEGVLPVCLGRATKVCDLLTDWDKEYRTVLLLGRTTDTQDMTGTVLRECPVSCQSGSGETMQQLTEDKIQRCIMSFVGEQQQVPPMYSALKVGGKKLYELARQGIEVERRPRTITISEIQIGRIYAGDVNEAKECPDYGTSPVPGRTSGFPEIEMTVRCSKGTYIRTLCNDIGEKLGCGGCMKELLRTKVGPFCMEDGAKLEEIRELRDADRLNEIIHPVDEVFGNLGKLVLTSEAERLVRNGNPLSPEMINSCVYTAGGAAQDQEVKDTVGGQLRIYAGNGEFLAVYEYKQEKNCWRAVKMFLP